MTCDRPVKTRGWCQTHYMRWYATGDVEGDRPIGRRIKGERPRLLANYAVSESGCWLPTRKAGSRGYTEFIRDDGRKQLRHRAAYEILVGPIPDGMQLDHLCHNVDATCAGGWTCLHRKCFNPAHLEPVTQSVNQRRSPHTGVVLAARERAKTHCPQGHEYTPENTHISVNTGGRICKECNRARGRARSYKNRGLPDPRRKYTDEQIAEVQRLLAAGLRNADVVRRTGVASASVSRIRNGKQRLSM